ncbi:MULTISPECIES: DNA polymerase III subunit gamma/tau [unclassified Roseateles]|uniref:DNA polymerase III subunit gamma/tau n=1 Tax=unclassified Roseateles TaxID=2626991 RepID=UPI0006F9C383|nr:MULTISPECIES: DNA polymerase III subunit gamma/tau [unclassified Roseateles]KQW44682.1 DNA polymerase III subunit gamma/tau [Pelomonas sp. Root405]KRA70041.1 DNA polymerase III subunit gamma/tau [Pelomonas sp. Root662]
MSYQVLARKYRPQSFEQLVGQEHVVQALANALTQGRLHHAYLFTGTRGVGKTTVSRILAKSLNCVGPDGAGGITAQPCGVCHACRDIDSGRFVDYVELDAASNRGVEEISQLLDQAVYKPVVGRFKVYMIDEVHMLSNTAFNAMLKTLEEPPDYLKFVLATTDPQKVPVTVLSRCLQFNLRPMAAADVQMHLGNVLGAENVPAEPGALRLLSRAARGSMRDGLSLTDQAIAFGAGSLTEAGVRQMLGSVDRGHVVAIVDALAAASGEAVVAQADALRGAGLSAAGTLEDLATLFQQMALAQAAPTALDDADTETAEIRRLAAALPADEIQLMYSMALHGRAELHLAPDEYAGLLMVLLRMLAFRPAGTSAKPIKAAALVRPPAVAKAVVAVPLPKVAPPAPVAAPVLAPVATPKGFTPAPVVAAPMAAEPSAPKLSDRLRPRPVEVDAQADDDMDGPPPDDAPPPWMEADDAPASVPAAARDVEAPRRAVLRETAEGAQWAERVAALNLVGMTAELARQAQALARRTVDGREAWTLRVERESLRAPALVAKLEAALDAQLHIEVGVAEDSIALRTVARTEAQQRAAEDLAAQHPMTRTLLSQFSSARILPGSVQPLTPTL